MTEALAFASTAPVRVVERVRVEAAPLDVFDALNDAEAVRRWWRSMRLVEWETPGPHGQGSLRRVSPSAGLVLRERIIGWVPGELWACTITDTSVPLFASYVIRVDLEPDEEGTVLTWTSAVEPSRLGRLAGPLFARIIRRTIRLGLAGMPAYFARR